MSNAKAIDKKRDPSKGGRPLMPIDEDLVRKLAQIHCTNEEIAAVCRCSKDTIEKRFSAIVKEGREEGRTSLRRHQWLKAEQGNVLMLIWLGKQILGQRDRPMDEAAQVTFNVQVQEVPK